MRRQIKSKRTLTNKDNLKNFKLLIKRSVKDFNEMVDNFLNSNQGLSITYSKV